MKEYPIGTTVVYDTITNGRREGVVVGYSVNDMYEDILMVCWTEDWKVTKCHPDNVYKIELN